MVKTWFQRVYENFCEWMDGFQGTYTTLSSFTAQYIVEEENITFLASDPLGCQPYTEKHTGENSDKVKK